MQVATSIYVFRRQKRHSENNIHGAEELEVVPMSSPPTTTALQIAARVCDHSCMTCHSCSFYNSGTNVPVTNYLVQHSRMIIT